MPEKVKFSSPANSPPGKSLRRRQDMLTNSNPTVKSPNPTREEIELRAFQIFIERGGTDGHDVDDWVEAERELHEEYANTGRMAKAATV
jgi:hypothetical protein